MENITFYYPKRLAFGSGCIKQMADDYLLLGLKRLFILTIPSILEQLKPYVKSLETNGADVRIFIFDKGEPTFSDLNEVLATARDFGTDSVAGIGGGSVLDLAKLIAAQLYNSQSLLSIIGNGLLKERKTYLICMPTTSGTGSEVSPNAILLDEENHAKKGIISPYLVPDATYVDPLLTVGLPPSVTAYTALDALTHCIEAFTNKFAHSMVDVFALKGIQLICSSLKDAFDDGTNIEARSNLALGSLYGGMCLGPVNTAAVHALAYPLGSEFKVGHGLSNALLLPYVMEFNLSAASEKYAAIGVAIGASIGKNQQETAFNAIAKIKKLMRDCAVPLRLSLIGIPGNSIEKLASSAMEVQRLLKNNVREVTYEDAQQIYLKAY
jgi:alcohol dehydrogenase class IV